MNYTADTLFTLEAQVPYPNKPEWANLVAKRIGTVPDDLVGPGLYALFFDDKLFYIGLHVTAEASFQASVLDRWVRHIVGQTLRAKVICFRPKIMAKILKDLSGAPIDDIAACLPEGRATAYDQLVGQILTNGSHCTFNKARFAARNWDRIGPGNETTMLGRIRCVFQPVPAVCETFLVGAKGKERGNWVREVWLRPLEKQSIREFRPICNAETVPGTEREDVSVAEVEVAFKNIMKTTTFSAFGVTGVGMHPVTGRPASRAVVDVFDANTGEAPSESEVALAEAEGLCGEEFRFRRSLSPAGVRIIDDLQEQCPDVLRVYYTNNKDLRVALATGRVLMVVTTSHGRLRISTLASVEVCQALGFEAEPIIGNTMRTRFYIDPAECASGALFAIAGAAVQVVVG